MKKFLISLALFIPTLIFGQIDDIKFKHLTSDNGLSQNYVKCIFRDSYGYLWVGTGNSGINRYDGKSFKVYKYNQKDTNGLSHSTINQIFEDKNRKLWVATLKGFSYYNRDLDKFESIPELSGININGFYFYNEKTLFFLKVKLKKNYSMNIAI